MKIFVCAYTGNYKHGADGYIGGYVYGFQLT